jgi:hypothetical protein
MPGGSGHSSSDSMWSQNDASVQSPCSGCTGPAACELVCASGA